MGQCYFWVSQSKQKYCSTKVQDSYDFVKKWRFFFSFIKYLILLFVKIREIYFFFIKYPPPRISTGCCLLSKNLYTWYCWYTSFGGGKSNMSRQCHYAVLWLVFTWSPYPWSPVEITPVLTTFLWILPICALLLRSMTHYDITMGHDIVRDAPLWHNNG